MAATILEYRKSNTIESSVGGLRGPLDLTNHVLDGIYRALRQSGEYRWMGEQCKKAEPIEMRFRGLTRASSRNNVSVGWTRRRNLLNTIEISAVPTKRQQPIHVPQRSYMQQRLSLYPMLTHSYVTLSFPHKNCPMRCGLSLQFLDHLLTFCAYCILSHKTNMMSTTAYL